MTHHLKELEKYYLGVLQKAMPGLPQVPPIPSEHPDFILPLETGRIGVEVTRLFKGADSNGRYLQAQESEQSMMVKQAMQLYAVSGNPPVEVNVHMAGHTQFNKTNRRVFAQKLSNLVAMHVPKDHSWQSIKNEFKTPDLFPYEFDAISIARYGHRRNYWSAPDGGWVQEDFVPELQEAIDKKNSLLTHFDASCSSHWLLVVIEGISGSTSFEPSQKTLEHVYRSDFHRLFLLERLKGTGYELTRSDAT
jgi:hypothetical protein